MMTTNYLPWILFVVMVTVYGPGPSFCNYTTPELDSQIPGQPSTDAEWIIPIAIAVSVGGGAGIIVLVAVTCYRLCKKTSRIDEERQAGYGGGHKESASPTRNRRPSSEEVLLPSKHNALDKVSVTAHAKETSGTDFDQQESTDIATSSTPRKTFTALKDEALNKLHKISPKEQGKVNVVSNSFAIGFFDESGGHLSIPDADVHLFIPPGAIEGTEEVYIYLTKNDIDTDGVTLGNILHCGPPGLQFHGHVMFSLPLPIRSCESIEKLWKIVPKQTQTDVGQTPEWEPITESENGLFFIEEDGKSCTFCVDHFTGHCILCDSMFLIGAFINPAETDTNDYFDFHVRCWKHGQSRDVLSMEYSKPLCTEPLSLCKDKGDLYLHIAAVTPGWLQVASSDSRFTVKSQQVSLALLERDFTEISTPFRFKKTSQQNQPFTCTIHAYQNNNTNVTTELTVMSPDICDEVLRVEERTAQLLPPDDFTYICKELDKQRSGWAQGPTDLARLLGLSFNVPEETAADLSLQGAAAAAPATAPQSVPTATVLGMWEQRNKGRGVEALVELQSKFHDKLQRPDLSQLLAPVIQDMRTAQNLVVITSKEPVQETCNQVTTEQALREMEEAKYPSNELNESGFGSGGTLNSSAGMADNGSAAGTDGYGSSASVNPGS